MKFTVTAIFSLFVDAFFILVGGFVLKVLWAWFIVPGFGFAALTMGAAVGIVLIVGFVASEETSKEDDEELGEFMLRMAIERTVRMAAYLAIGAVLAALLF